MGIARVFHRSDGVKADTTCPMPAHLRPGAQFNFNSLSNSVNKFSSQLDAPDNFVGDLTFHQFNMTLSGACTGVTCLVIFVVMARHATHLSHPNQQLK